VILGRGSSIESFPLFGFDLADYERLFEEKLDLFAQLRTERPVTWSGTTRAAMPGMQVNLRIAGGALPTGVGVGGSPASVVRAARYGFSLMLAIIGGNPARFARLSELYREATAQSGFAPLPIGVHSPAHVAATDEQAKEECASWFDLKYGMGPMPHATLMENIRLCGTEVATRVRERLQTR
jgi:alkanesulfonate monooxygenase SsuD/methylene tetrahydromethanopterin reductase-like flavin-dependent oxidoreductase (luciferase family)